MPEYLPIAHTSQIVPPGEEEYVPAPQSSQKSAVPVVAVDFPVGQEVQDAAPATEYDPAEQLRHSLNSVAPTEDLYVPAGQSIQLPLFKFKYLPTGHPRHWLERYDPSGLNFPAGQAVQIVA